MSLGSFQRVAQLTLWPVSRAERKCSHVASCGADDRTQLRFTFASTVGGNKAGGA